MANLLWAKVYFLGTYAGILREESDGGSSFTYDSAYIEAKGHPLSVTLPVQSAPIISHTGLLPYFDNLVGEGWLRQSQTYLLGKRYAIPMELLLEFGHDCFGAVTIVDPEPKTLPSADFPNLELVEKILLDSRMSLSGVQPKLAVCLDDRGHIRFPQQGERSTHIIKMPSPAHHDLLENEYLTTLACKILLPKEDIVDITFAQQKEFDQPFLLIKRFDREMHAEEFAQLLNIPAEQKYDAHHKDMANFIRQSSFCLETERLRLFQRIVVGLLLGNTDMHLKNFAMVYASPNQLRLAPLYDQVCAAIYGYKIIALKIANINHDIGRIGSQHLKRLAKEFDLGHQTISLLKEDLAKQLPKAKQAIADAPHGSTALKDNIIRFMEKRWNSLFHLIGQK